MKKAIFIALAIMGLACSKPGNAALTGKWILSEELIDIGDGKGTFKASNTQLIIEFLEDGTFTSSHSFCPGGAAKNKKGTGTYSTASSKILPANCTAGEAGNITFELSGSELILSLPGIEAHKQKYRQLN